MLRGSRLSHEELSVDPKSRYRTLLDALRGTAERSPRRGLYVIDDKGNQEFRTYAQILESALRVGAALEQRGLGKHDRVLFVLPTGFEFVSAFFGAISIGAIPIPIAPPPDVSFDASDRAEAILRLATRLQTAAALFGARENTASRPPQYKDLRLVMDIPALLEGVPVGATPSSGTGGDIAYIQPTSGATGRRRAVELTHRNILSNVDGVGRRLSVTADDIGVSWLPLHSILGLVGVVLFGLYWEIDVVLMSTERFLRRPEEWLRLFGRHGGTLAASPDFGYDYCVRRCQRSNLEGIDLSSWRVALNGGETVRRQHMEAFRRRFGQYGLSPDVFCPVYGLTEATLAVSFAQPGRAVLTDNVLREPFETDGVAETCARNARPDRKLEFVSVGAPLHNIDLMIIDYRGIEVPDRTVGEIAVCGPTIMRGYFDQPKKKSDGGTRISGEWLMTGDLGYVADGELFVVSRSASAFEFGGRTIYPHLFEDVIESVDGVRSGSAVVFGTEEPERLVVAFEIQAGAEPEEIEGLVRSRVYRHFRMEPDEVRCLSAQSIPRSATGKVRRHLVKLFYRRGMLDRKERNAEFEGVRRLFQRSRHEALKLGQSLAGEVRRLLSREDKPD